MSRRGGLHGDILVKLSFSNELTRLLALRTRSRVRHAMGDSEIGTVFLFFVIQGTVEMPRSCLNSAEALIIIG